MLPHQPSTNAKSIPVLIALKNVMYVTTSADFLLLLNKLINVGSNTIFCIYIYYKPSRGLHDAFLTKVFTAFFGGGPSTNPLSTNARVTHTRQNDLARQVD